VRRYGAPFSVLADLSLDTFCATVHLGGVMAFCYSAWTYHQSDHRFI
jgi:hypothetical protein